MAAVGVDACASGWIAVTLDCEGIAAFYLPTIDSIGSAIPEATAIAIDIPIGIPLAEHRHADLAARSSLGVRRNSVFLTPIRAALEAPTHAAASALAKEATGSGISQQSYALRAKILEVDKWLPSSPCSVWEVHPELSFAVLMGQPATAPKKSWAGMVERRHALSSVGIDLDRIEGPAAMRAAVDDMLDAGVAAWTARRLLDGIATPFPDPPSALHNGRAVAIWA